jgi:acyl-CoA thioester hydrolase
MGEPFAHTLRVRYAECDAQGVVFNANYLAYVDVSMTELWRAAFGGYNAMLDRGVDLVVAETHLRFEQPARFDDELTLEVAITRLGNSSIVSDHRVRRGRDSLAQVSIRHVVVDRQTLRKAPIPDWARTGLAPWVRAAHQAQD